MVQLPSGGRFWSRSTRRAGRQARQKSVCRAQTDRRALRAAETALRAQLKARHGAAAQHRGAPGVQTARMSVCDDQTPVCGSGDTRGYELWGYLDAAGQSAAETALRAQVWARIGAAVQNRGALRVQTAGMSVVDDKSSVCESRGTREHELWGWCEGTIAFTRWPRARDDAAESMHC